MVNPLHAQDFEAGLDMALDPGIRSYVLMLRSEGIETFESCEGGPGHAFPEPTIRFYGNHVEGFRAFTVAMNHGLPVFNIRRVYDVNDGELCGPWWEMTFRIAELESEVESKDKEIRQ